MKLLKNIARQLAAILTVVVFFLTTTGFTLYKHICEHDGKSISLTTFDNCCEELVAEPVSSCCEETIPAAGDRQESDCCEEDQSYYKLSNFYVQSEEKDNTQDCGQQTIMIIKNDSQEEQESGSIPASFNTHKKKPDRRKYQLYNRIKIEPPLI
jgi:hypothetical protein